MKNMFKFDQSILMTCVYSNISFSSENVFLFVSKHFYGRASRVYLFFCPVRRNKLSPSRPPRLHVPLLGGGSGRTGWCCL